MLGTVGSEFMFVIRGATWEFEDDEVDGSGSIRTGAEGTEADVTGCDSSDCTTETFSSEMLVLAGFNLSRTVLTYCC